MKDSEGNLTKLTKHISNLNPDEIRQEILYFDNDFNHKESVSFIIKSVDKFGYMELCKEVKYDPKKYLLKK